MQQRSTEQCSSVDSRHRRLTNFKILVGQSWRSPSKCQIKCSKYPQEHVNSLVRMLSKSVTFFCIFRLSQGSVATYCRWGGILLVYDREFSYESNWWKNNVKISPHLPKLLTNIKWLTFSRRCIFCRVFAECVDCVVFSASLYTNCLVMGSLQRRWITDVLSSFILSFWRLF